MLNNPIRFSDPSGHKPCDDIDKNGRCITYEEEWRKQPEPPIPPIETPTTNSDPFQYKELSELSISDNGKEFIKMVEGFVDYPDDNDGANNCSIGYGHLIHTGKCDGSASEIEIVNSIKSKSEYLDNLFAIDLAEKIEIVQTNVSVPMTQSQFDAIVSFVYNIPPSLFLTSDLLIKLNNADYESVPYELNRWVFGKDAETNMFRKIDGLVRRREFEARLFENGDYSLGEW